MSEVFISREAIDLSPHKIRIESGEFLPDAFFASGGRISVNASRDVMIAHNNINELLNFINVTELASMSRTHVGGVIHFVSNSNTPCEEECQANAYDIRVNALREQAATNVQPMVERELGTRHEMGRDPEPEIGPDRIADDETETEELPQCVRPITADYTAAQTAEPDERYQVKIASVFNTEISAMARNVDTMQKEFDDMFSKLIKLKRKIMLALTPLNDNPIITQIIDSISAARQHAKVEQAFINISNNVIVITKPIVTLPVSGSPRLVGKMMITMPLQMFVGENPSVGVMKIHNLTHVISDRSRTWQAPHVVDNGGSCFGNSMQLIFDAIVAKDISLVVSAVIQFLEQPNVGDPYGRCAAFLPVVMRNE